MSDNKPTGAMAQVPNDDKRPTTITISTGSNEEANIERVLEQVPLANRHAVAKAGLKVGLALLLEKPTLIIDVLRDEKMRITARGGAR
jgi:hypothetical protein